jgi:hypothetical protein
MTYGSCLPMISLFGSLSPRMTVTMRGELPRRLGAQARVGTGPRGTSVPGRVAPPRRHRTVQEREARWVVTVWLPVTPQFRVLVLSCSRALVLSHLQARGTRCIVTSRLLDACVVQASR